MAAAPPPTATHGDLQFVAPTQWARQEFALAELGDRRRTQRLVNLAQGLAAQPGEHLLIEVATLRIT